MSQKKAKKERFEKQLKDDLALANSSRTLEGYINALPLNKAMVIECEAIDERNIRLPQELGGLTMHLQFSYMKPDSGKVALVIKKNEKGEPEFGIKSIDIFSRKNALIYDKPTDSFKN